MPVSGPDVAGVTSVDQAITALLTKWNVPGATVAITKNGQLILARGYGYADFEAKQVMQPDSMSRIGSISKVLTSMAVLHLKDQGLLNLDDKFLTIMGEYQAFATGDIRLRDITIRHLLQHSGGWDRSRSGDPLGWHERVATALSVPTPVTCPDIIRYMMGQPLDFAPGSRYHYSNFGYCILGQVVEEVSGEPYEIYVRDHVLATMDVRAMSIGYSRLSERGPYEVKYYAYDGAPLVDSLYAGEGKVPAPYVGEMLTAGAAGGWIGSAIDLTRVMTAIDGSRGAPFLSSATLAEFIANPHLAGAGNPNYWYGFGIGVGPTPDSWHHGGSISGAQSQLTRDARGYTWAIITNARVQDSETFADEMNSAMMRALEAGLEGSAYDLYPEFASPTLPPRHQ